MVALDSGAGLANATLQLRLVPVRLFYDYLIEEGLQESNPVRRGRYTPGRECGGHQRGLVPCLTKLPWIPGEQRWLDPAGQRARQARTQPCHTSSPWEIRRSGRRGSRTSGAGQHRCRHTNNR